MNILQAQIILKNRSECMQRVAKLGERCGRCSICPLHTSLDDYITAKEIVERSLENRMEFIARHSVYGLTADKEIAGEHTKAVLDSLCKEVSNETE